MNRLWGERRPTSAAARPLHRRDEQPPSGAASAAPAGLPWLLRHGEAATQAGMLLSLQGSVGNQALQPLIATVLQQDGQPLDASARATLEPAFGQDLSQVRIHTDPLAATSAQAAAARAYTVGDAIVFAEGRYAPATSAGQRLLAHELTHVVQQRQAGPPVLVENLSQAGDTAEREAAAVANLVTAGYGVAGQIQAAPGGTLAREDAEEEGGDWEDLNDPVKDLLCPEDGFCFHPQPFEQEGPSPDKDYMDEQRRRWQEDDAKRRGDQYPNPFNAPSPAEKFRKEHENTKDFWPKQPNPGGPVPHLKNPWDVDPTLPPWLLPDWPWPPLYPPLPPPQLGDFPLPEDDWRPA